MYYINEWFRLEKVGLKKSIIANLIRHFNTYEKMIHSDVNYLKSLNISDEVLKKIDKSKEINLDKEQSILIKLGIRVLCVTDEKYPFLLKNISNPPLFLYVKGNGEFTEKSIAVVGTRKSTRYGRACTEKIVSGLVEHDVTVISGMALGIDSIAHKQVIQKNGKTIGVLACGLAVDYPKENRSLKEKILEKGLMVSEYPPDTQPSRWTFPERNRIIIGLAKGTVIAESYKKGGSLISGKITLDENRELFAVPGMISYPSYEGCNNIIKKGEAKLITSAKDIAEEFYWKKCSSTKQILPELSKYEKRVYYSLNNNKNVDKIIMETGYTAQDVLIFLMELELKGLIKNVGGGVYSRI